ncbi:hypothetical protein GCM10022288_03230 [Gryllotalpicola kribbensis]|uniref:Uncharacterized protein n=1 Tax=Gryllotalpicola kribbensis TaxID=993084 RepID=A0ABP8AGQ1_9MICO
MPRAATRSLLCSFGHIATHAELLEEFDGQESAILPFRMSYGRSELLRMGVYVCTHLTDLERLAAWCGGQLDCVTVLAESGFSVGDGGEPHLRLRRGQGGASGRRRADAPMAHVHWSRLRTPVPSREQAKRLARSGGQPDRLRVPPREALRQAMTTCLSYAESAQLLEAMSEAGFPAEDIAHAIAAAPRRVHLALRRLDAVPAPVRDVLSDSYERENHF